MKGFKTLSIVAALVILFTGAVMAQKFGRFGMGGPGGPGMGGPGGFGMGRGLMELDLSDAQKTEVADIIKKYRDQTENAVDSLMAAKKNLDTVIHVEEFNEADVRQTFQTIASAQEELVVLMAKIFSEIRPVLTPEQIASLEERRAGRAERMKEWIKFRRSMFDRWLGTEG
ncbi:Spy/CpxP family protein refolding chaperone [Desulfobacterales bacterium HSG2]|nr:Spy/CpxP family protein refolding chaperone [Desulfobacterales bacterium HSG2]